MSVSRTDRKRVTATHSAGVRPLLLEVAGLTLSGLLAEPPQGEPRATVVAVHGGGMRAGYFDGQADADLSLLTLGARLGFTVLALDRPGYGASGAQLPAGLTLAEQSDVLAGALEVFADRHRVGRGFLLLGHSFGGKLALTTVARHRGVLAVDASGVGHRYQVEPLGRRRLHRRLEWERNWGPLGLYPPGTFRAAEAMVAPIPEREAAEIPLWPAMFDALAARITLPLRLTFAEHEGWWLHQESDLAEMASRLTAAPLVRVERQLGAGHNISLGRAARSYHLRALAFFTECLQADQDTGAPARDAAMTGAAAAS
ncbi:alpha/beta hydrolase [Streptacidiphilus pinicola]|uniref:Alpha/beta hydrolase n=1 Tax=Streptacidiphilus pinicola TaxID=2219663 RepID=A0A2X0IP77_9ACTN|nr:alpha/beta fold hydrolase [Streptacidiphilus pinicola]RAG85333.1 alpha/beta hydrolase [Streptacidiphilus pinicola]